VPDTVIVRQQKWIVKGFVTPVTEYMNNKDGLARSRPLAKYLWT